jgi:hypothetical protein
MNNNFFSELQIKFSPEQDKFTVAVTNSIHMSHSKPRVEAFDKIHNEYPLMVLSR